LHNTQESGAVKKSLLQSTHPLLTVPSTVSRLGCRLGYFRALDLWADIGVLSPPRVAHRLQNHLGRII
jgi:hypothetical protein